MGFPKGSISVIPPSLPPGSCDQVIPQSSVDRPKGTPTTLIVSRQSEPGTRYVFERWVSIKEFYFRICGDDREHMLGAALRRADMTYFGDHNGEIVPMIMQGKTHIGYHRTGDTREEFTLFYR